ncbi:hypothetical protein ACFVZ3_06440 [Kitasatospora purpeofusca]|uniref:hypothetical protein n=1 Tax=Kitasatospora purpeofusca TaxID=67352 RepID=UPI0036C3D19B
MLVAELKGFLNRIECELPTSEAARSALGEGAVEQALALVAAENAVLPQPVLTDLEGVARDAAGYRLGTTAERCGYLERQAKLLHDIVDATGDTGSDWIADDATGRPGRAGPRDGRVRCSAGVGPSHVVAAVTVIEGR